MTATTTRRARTRRTTDDPTPAAAPPASTAAASTSGSAYFDPRSRKHYLSVSIGTRDRVTKPSPVATDLDDAKARARLASELVAQLRASGRDTRDLLVTTVAQCGAVPLDKLADVRAMVAAVVGGAVPVAGHDATASKANAKAKGPTYGEIADEWTSGRLRKRFPDVVEEVSPHYATDVESKLRRFVLPVVRNVPIGDFTLDHAIRVMQRVPATMSKSSRSQIAQHLRRVVSFAVYPLRYLTANPIPPQFMPRQGRGRERNMLFPDEDRRMLACVDNPIELRLLFGFMAREGMRKEEACSLEWRAVDLERGWVYLDRNKTKSPRDWPLDAGVAEALRRWRKLHPRARYVFGGQGPVATDGLAEVLRACLARAGVMRPQLHEKTPERMRAGTHDLRATFVTLAIAQGRGEGWIRRRTGHTTSNMIERYRRNAEGLAEGPAMALAPLWQGLPELAGADVAEVAAAAPAAPAAGAVSEPRTDTSGAPSVCNGGASSSLAAIADAQSNNADPGFSSAGVAASFAVEDMGIEPTASRVRFAATCKHDAESSVIPAVASDASPRMTTPTDDVQTPARSLRDDLAEVIARAVREGEIDLAARLIEATRAIRPAAEVTVLADERARRR